MKANPKLNNVAKILRENYFLFFRTWWDKISSDDFVSSPHIEYIAEELQTIGECIINRTKTEYDWYIFNVPPGSTKTSLVSILFPTWLMVNDPSIFSINTSYSDDLATDSIRKSFLIFESEDFIDIFGQFEFTKKNANFIETKQNGGRFAGSTGGTLTGKHANILISDDPISVEMSYSKAERDKANRFITQTLTTRKRDKEKTPIIMIMQRLHDEDPTGYILHKAKHEGLKVKHICLPAEISTISTNNELYTDGLLDPIRMSKDILDKIKIELGSFGYAGQFEQRPYAEEGGRIKRAWFNLIEESELPQHIIWDVWIDGAFTDKTSNDPTGIGIIGHDKATQRIYVRNYSHTYSTMPNLIKLLPEISHVHGVNHRSRAYIEPKASGHSLEQHLRSTHMNPILIKSWLVGAGKMARCETASPSIQASKWFLVKGNWNEEYLSQMCGFPTAKHDEAIDISGYAAEHYLGRTRTPGIRIIN